MGAGTRHNGAILNASARLGSGQGTSTKSRVHQRHQRTSVCVLCWSRGGAPEGIWARPTGVRLAPAGVHPAVCRLGAVPGRASTTVLHLVPHQPERAAGRHVTQVGIVGDSVCGEGPREGLVWFGSRLAPVAVTHGQCVRTSLARLGTPLGCLVSQPPRLLTIPVPRQGADERETPPCLYVWARVPGGPGRGRGRGRGFGIIFSAPGGGGAVPMAGSQKVASRRALRAGRSRMPKKNKQIPSHHVAVHKTVTPLFRRA